MAAFKPSYYTGTLVFCASLIFVILLLVAVLILSKEWRPYIDIFTVVFGLLGLAMVIGMFLNIFKVEKAYTAKANAPDDSYKYISCPDTHVAAGKVCKIGTANMTLDDYIVGISHSGKRVEYTASTDIDISVVKNRKNKAEFVSTDCANAAWQVLPWSSYKSLCPSV